MMSYEPLDSEPLNRLFVYGIFLDELNRELFGMSNPEYTTVRGYATVGNNIVEAVKDSRYTLTGLVVDVDPKRWSAIDALESGYNRIKVLTTDNEFVYMYEGKGYEKIT